MRKVSRVKLISERPTLDIQVRPANIAASGNNPCNSNLTIQLDNREIRLVKEIEEVAAKSLPEIIVYESLISILSQDDIAKFDIEINNSDDNGLSTVNDPRLGAGFDYVCATCNLTINSCPGHFGRIELPFPLYHPMYIKDIIYVLNSVCNRCARLVISKETMDKLGISILSGRIRLKRISDVSKSLPCPSKCQREFIIFNIKESSDNGELYYTKRGNKDKQIFDIKDADKILKAITPETWKLLGFNPEAPPSFILRRIPVLPPQDRPYVNVDGEILPDDLTVLYKTLLNHINSYRELERKKSKSTNDVIALTELANKIKTTISLIIDNSDGRSFQGTKQNKIIMGIKQRIQGKEGFIRGSMMGKRTNFTARTVISPDPTLKFGQVRIPKIFESSLTQNVVVTHLNINELTKLLREGRISTVYKVKDNRKGPPIHINEDNKDKINLQVGDIVNRYLQNGDYVIINRQPTLHKYGMMGHEVVLGPNLTIGIHPSVTTPFNADFDGDEMNVHAVQTPEALAEVMRLMNVKHCVMNVQNNRPVLGAVYDSLSGAFMLTQPNVRVKGELFMNIYITLIDPPDLQEFITRITKYTENELIQVEGRIFEVSGRCLFSLLFPPDFQYVKDQVIVYNGVLLAGVVNKDHIGTSHNSMVQVMWKNYGVERTANFITNIGWLINKWLDSNPLTVTLADCLPQDKELRKKIEEEVAKVRIIVESLGVRFNDPIEEERKEQEIIQHLQNTRNNITNLAYSAISPDNTLRIMTLSGAKGSKVNVVQIMGILSQQFLRNQRIPIKLGDGLRCLPWFNHNSTNPFTRGFCVNSFINGLSPAEFFFHQAASREGLLDTAIKTPETGDINHKLAKALEDIMVMYDGSVRNPNGNIFQFVYGEDGFNPAELENFNSKYGRQTFFINVYRVAQQLNAKYGYPPTPIEQTTVEKDVEDIEHDIVMFNTEEDFDNEED